MHSIVQVVLPDLKVDQVCSTKTLEECEVLSNCPFYSLRSLPCSCPPMSQQLKIVFKQRDTLFLPQ